VGVQAVERHALGEVEGSLRGVVVGAVDSFIPSCRRRTCDVTRDSGADGVDAGDGMTVERRYNAGVSAGRTGDGDDAAGDPDPDRFLDDDGAFDVGRFVLRTTHEVWDERRFERIEDYFADEFVSFGAEGREFADLDELYDYAAWRTAAFPDTRVYVDDLFWVHDDGRYHTSHRFTVTGTNTGPSPYGDPTGKRLRLTGIANCTVARVDGRWQYTAERAEDDQFAILRACTPGRTGPYPPLPASDGSHGAPDGDAADGSPAADGDDDGPTIRTGEGVRAGGVDPVARLLSATDAVWNDRSVGALSDYYADDVRVEAASGRDRRGVDQLRDEVLARLSAFPDLTVEVDELLVVEDGPGYDSSTAYTVTGTHAGPSRYGSATDVPVSYTGIVNRRLRRVDGDWLVVELREAFDERRLTRLLTREGG
jgi:hypothetical protein